MKAEEKKSEVYILKWLTLGCLGVLSLITVLLISLLYFFSPLASFDEGKISFLGGAFSFDGSDTNFMSSKASARWHHYDTHYEEGSYLPKVGKKKLSIFFSETTADFSWTKKKSIHWNCTLKGTRAGPIDVEEKGKELILSLEETKSCELKIPKNLELFVEAKNGQINLKEPSNNYDITLTNGILVLRPHDKIPFQYDLQVGNGMIGSFKDLHSSSPSAKKSKIRMENGSILHEE